MADARDISDLQLGALLSALRGRRPLVHLISNLVTLHAVAGALRAVGALPVAALAPEDAEEAVLAADALVLNLGTPTGERMEAATVAGRKAEERGIPVVLDPVGAGATPLRTDGARRVLAAVRVDVIRSNPGEASALLGRPGMVRGVESVGAVEDGAVLARSLARELGCVAAITGPTDSLAGPGGLVLVENGHPWLGHAVGTGCIASALVGAFCAVGSDRLSCAAAALACLGVASEAAASDARGPGSLIPAVLDALYHMTPEGLDRSARVRVVP